MEEILFLETLLKDLKKEWRGGIKGFLSGGTVTSLKTEIPKFLGGNYFPKVNLREAAQPTYLTILKLLKEIQTNNQRQKATQYKSPARKKIAQLQQALYEIGAFDKLSHDKVVNGYNGKLTQAAIARAKQAGYVIDMSKGTVTKRTTSNYNTLKTVVPQYDTKTKRFAETPEVSTAKEERKDPFKWERIFEPLNKAFKVIGGKKEWIRSANLNLQAIIDHKKSFDIQEPYFYINPLEGKMYRMLKDKILEAIPIASGVNQSTDGWTPLAKKANGAPDYDRGKNSSATPAGVFTLSRSYTTPGLYNSNPYYILQEAKRGNPDARQTNVAIHEPASRDRANKAAMGNTRLSFGCIQVPDGKTRCLTDEDLIHRGDSVYIEPTVSGNYLYEDEDGHIKTHFGSTPSHISGSIYGKHFNLNNQRFSIGY